MKLPESKVKELSSFELTFGLKRVAKEHERLGLRERIERKIDWLLGADVDSDEYKKMRARGERYHWFIPFD